MDYFLIPVSLSQFYLIDDGPGHLNTAGCLRVWLKCLSRVAEAEIASQTGGRRIARRNGRARHGAVFAIANGTETAGEREKKVVSQFCGPRAAHKAPGDSLSPLARDTIRNAEHDPD